MAPKRPRQKRCPNCGYLATDKPMTARRLKSLIGDLQAYLNKTGPLPKVDQPYFRAAKLRLVKKRI